MAMVSKRSESFDNDFFFDIEAKRTRSIVQKLISKRSEHVQQLEKLFQSEANMFILKNLNIEAKQLNIKLWI